MRLWKKFEFIIHQLENELKQNQDTLAWLRSKCKHKSKEQLEDSEQCQDCGAIIV